MKINLFVKLIKRLKYQLSLDNVTKEVVGLEELWVENAREFAESALSADAASVVIQNAYKAAEFAICLYAHKRKTKIPRDHLEAKKHGV